jgi:hypothetical protein
MMPATLTSELDDHHLNLNSLSSCWTPSHLCARVWRWLSDWLLE